jgi:formate dehydrogenase beta subunit
MVNWKSNVFPGILGRTCDRPCEPACRRGRVEEEAAKPEPVAICRLKRVAADLQGATSARAAAPPRAEERQARRLRRRRAGLADGGARPRAARLRGRGVRRQDPKAGGMIRTQIPRFRLPEA